MQRALDPEQKEIPLAYTITCPVPAGYDRRPISLQGFKEAAILALYLQRSEYVVVWLADPSPEYMRALFFFPDAEGIATVKASSKPDMIFMRPERALSPDEYVFFREKADIALEDSTYGDCRALVMNIEASTKDPSRAQACSNTMAVIDRSRAARREEADRQQRRAEAENQRRQLDYLEAQADANRRWQEEQAAHQRRMDVLRALNSYHPEPIPLRPITSPTVHTNCSTIGQFTNCTSH